MSAGSIESFISRWSASAAAERANKDLFLTELCDALGVPRPDPATGDVYRDSYVFEKSAFLIREGPRPSTGFVDLYGADEVLRRLYFALRSEIVEPPLPVLQNTDGDPLETQVLTWKVSDPEEAFHALASMCVTETEREIRPEATLDRSRRVRRVAFSWDKLGNKINKDWTNTVLGRVEIDGTKLTIEVNSVRRAELARAEVKKRLGGTAFGPSIEEVPFDPAAAARKGPSKFRRRESEEVPNGACADSPELVEVARRYEEAHWDSWVDEKIPALGNKKPSQLVKTAEGREMVEALLRSFERRPRPSGRGRPSSPVPSPAPGAAG